VKREQNHLTIEQIECLMGIQPAEGAALEGARLREQAQAHLVECEACRKLLSMEIEADRNLRDLQRGIPIERRELCPPSNTLYKVAGGVLKEKDSETLMKHITECDHCGPAFRQAVSDLGSEGTSEEASIIASLATSRPQWQEKFARRLASTASKEDIQVTPVTSRSPRERLFFSKIHWAYAVAAVLIIGVTVVEGGRAWRSRPSYTQQLLENAGNPNSWSPIRALAS
jgi:hypothetical protein